MGINEILLIVAALVPAIVLCAYVYKKDRADKEPAGILFLLLVCGVIICFPAIWLETLFDGWVNGFFSMFGTVDSSGVTLLSTVPYTIYQFCSNTLGVALVEEGLKWIVLITVAKNTKHFNSLFDGIIYAVFVSLGFAAYENVLYVLNYGWINAVMRAVMSVPGHMFFAVIMGYFYSRYYIIKATRGFEQIYKAAGVISSSKPVFSEKNYLVLSLLMPVLCHGTYNFCMSMDSTTYLIIGLILVVLLYVYCFRYIKDTSKHDTHVLLCVLKLLENKYPGFTEKITKIGDATQGGNSYSTPVGAPPSISMQTTETFAKNKTAPGIKFGGVYAKTSGTVHIVADLRKPILAGDTIATIRSAFGEEISIVADYNGQIDKYNVKEGEFVSENNLLGVIKYSA